MDLITHFYFLNRRFVEENFENTFHQFIKDGFIHKEFKINFRCLCLKYPDYWFCYGGDIFVKVLKSPDIISRILESKDLYILLVFFLGNMNRRNFSEDNNRFKYLVKHFTTLLGFVYSGKTTYDVNIETIVENGNWKLLVNILGLLERCYVSSDFFFDYYSCPSKFHKYMDSFYSMILRSIMKIQKHSTRKKVLKTILKSLLTETYQFENEVKNSQIKSSLSVNQKQDKLGVLSIFLSQVLYLDTILDSNKNALIKSNDQDFDIINQIFREINISRFEKIDFYMILMKNFLFFLKQINGIEDDKKLKQNINDALAIDRNYILLFKTLFHLDSDFQFLLIPTVEEGLSIVFETDKRVFFGEYIQSVFHFFFEIVLNENVFEEFYVKLSLIQKSSETSLFSNKELEEIIDHTPGIVYRLQTICTKSQSLDLKKLSEKLVSCNGNMKLLNQLIEYIISEKFNYDHTSKSFDTKSMTSLRFIYPNLLFSDKSFLKSLSSEVGFKTLNQNGFYYWNHSRVKYGVNFLKSSGLEKFIVSCYFQVCDSRFQNTENATKLPVLFVKNLLVLIRATQDRNVVVDFLMKVSKECGKDFNLLLHQTMAELQISTSAIPIVSKAKPTSKNSRKHLHLLQKIRRKTQRLNKKEIQTRNPLKYDVCMTCSMDIPKNEKAYIFRIHKDSVHTVFGNNHLDKVSFNIFSTCGHVHHTSCIKDLETVKCAYCSKSGFDYISDFDITEPNLEIQRFVENELEPHFGNCLDYFSILTNPILQAVFLMEVLDQNILENNIVPVLKVFAKILYLKSEDYHHQQLLRMIHKNHRRVTKELQPLHYSHKKSNDLVLEGMCSELLFAKVVIYSFFKDIRKHMKNSEDFDVHQEINLNLRTNISNQLWKFIILKLLQVRDLDFTQINEKLLLLECKSIFKTCLLLESVLTVKTGNNTETPFPNLKDSFLILDYGRILIEKYGLISKVKQNRDFFEQTHKKIYKKNRLQLRLYKSKPALDWVGNKLALIKRRRCRDSLQISSMFESQDDLSTKPDEFYSKDTPSN